LFFDCICGDDLLIQRFSIYLEKNIKGSRLIRLFYACHKMGRSDLLLPKGAGMTTSFPPHFYTHSLSFSPAKVVMLMTRPTKAAKPNTAFPTSAMVLPMAKPTSMATANPIPELRT
jgi:hypothetical protein